MLSGALHRARRLAPQTCDRCELAFTAGQLAALPPVSSSIAARRCRCGGIVVVGS